MSRLRSPGLLFVGLTLAVTVLPAEARADEDTSPITTAPGLAPRATSATSPTTRWYGWQTLTVDIANNVLSSTALIAMGGAKGSDYGLYSQPSPGLLALSLATTTIYLVGGPTVHALNGHSDRAGLSLITRAVLPTLTGLTGGGIGLIAGNGAAPEAFGGVVIGGSVGVLTAIVLDSAAFSTEKSVRDRAPDASPRRAAATSTIVPTATVTPKGDSMIGLGGTF